MRQWTACGFLRDRRAFECIRSSSFRSPYYVVDRLFGAAELRLGADKAAVVRIERTDGVGSTARRH